MTDEQATITALAGAVLESETEPETEAGADADPAGASFSKRASSCWMDLTMAGINAVYVRA